jgi:hypothetical protein
MLEIAKKVVTLDPEEVLELERIITDADQKGAYLFVKKAVYGKLVRSQESRLKSHLDGHKDPAGFLAENNGELSGARGTQGGQ